MPKIVLFTMSLIAIAIVLVVSMDVGSSGTSLSGSQSNNANDYIAIRDALRRGGLREAAKLKGHYVRAFDPHWDFGQFDIESLTKNSAAVIVGAATRELEGRLTPDGLLIFTDYEVEIQEVIKGDLKLGGSITVGLIGGRFKFEDGTSAEVKTLGFERVKVGGTYIFFLSVSEATPVMYTLTGGPQGLVQVVDNEKVKSHGRPTDPIAEESKKMNKDTFLKEVRKQAKQWPHPGKCCS